MKRYRLKKSCCVEISVTLCLHHLATRIKQGWTMLRDDGADSINCYDCALEGKV